ncbi:MAG: hypothetical protein ACTSYX_01290 [Candidatus Thorarchaeota archaeon]
MEGIELVREAMGRLRDWDINSIDDALALLRKFFNLDEDYEEIEEKDVD